MASDSESDPLDWLEDPSREPGGSRVEFQQQLAACDTRLVRLARSAADRIVPVTTAFLQADTHTAGTVAGGDEIDTGCVELEEACYALIARQSPVAGDLRRVIAVVHSVNDVRRTAKLLQHVSESLSWVHPPALHDELRNLVSQLGTVSAEIFQGAVTAWERHDALAANELEQHDDQVDFLQRCLLTELYTGKQSVEEAVSLALLGRYYERIADHAVAVARQLSYFLTGERP